MSRQNILLSALALTGLAVLAGCRDDSAPLRGSQPPVVQRAVVADEIGRGSIGAYGYQPSLIGNGYTGNGGLLSAGLPARGGGPVSEVAQPIRGLAPRETIGSPMSDATERVVVDTPTGEQVQIHSQRHRD